MVQSFKSRAEYEAALQAAAAYIDRGTEPGSAADQDLNRLLDQIVGYRHEAPAAAPSAVVQLEARIDAFARRRADDVFLRRDDPDGIGPTLGPDVSRG